MTDHRINLVDVEAKLNGHSIFAPSSSAMWLNCSGSLIPNLLAPDTAGYEAVEGTVAHSVAERWLRTSVRPTELVGTIEHVIENDREFDIPITDEMLDHLEEYVDWVSFLPGDHFVETKVDFSDLTPIPKQRGTADHAACEPGKLTITDLKFGEGIQVFAKNNSQGLLYAYGFFREYDWLYGFEKIVIRIAQPRRNHFDEWTITRKELLEFAEYARERAFAAWIENAPRVAGEKQCTWCRVRETCPAAMVLQAKLADGVFENLDDEVTAHEICKLKERISADTLQFDQSDPSRLSLAELAKVYQYRDVVDKWWKVVGELLYSRLLAGENVPGYKLVQGRSSRNWKNAFDAAEHLEFIGLSEDDIYVREMVSPPQAEQALVKKGVKKKELPTYLSSVVKVTPGKPTMADESDKRPAIVINGSFDNLDEEL